MADDRRLAHQRAEAERIAFKIVLVEFLNRTYPDTPSESLRVVRRGVVLLPMCVSTRKS